MNSRLARAFGLCAIAILPLLGWSQDEPLSDELVGRINAERDLCLGLVQKKLEAVVEKNLGENGFEILSAQVARPNPDGPANGWFSPFYKTTIERPRGNLGYFEFEKNYVLRKNGQERAVQLRYRMNNWYLPSIKQEREDPIVSRHLIRRFARRIERARQRIQVKTADVRFSAPEANAVIDPAESFTCFSDFLEHVEELPLDPAEIERSLSAFQARSAGRGSKP